MGTLRSTCTSTRKYWSEPGFHQNPCNLFPIVALNLDPTFLDRSLSTARLLHLLREPLLLGQSNADKVLHHCHRFTLTSFGVSDDVHAAS
jgi:hypothetical protein